MSEWLLHFVIIVFVFAVGIITGAFIVRRLMLTELECYRKICDSWEALSVQQIQTHMYAMNNADIDLRDPLDEPLYEEIGENMNGPRIYDPEI